MSEASGEKKRDKNSVLVIKNIFPRPLGGRRVPLGVALEKSARFVNQCAYD